MEVVCFFIEFYVKGCDIYWKVCQVVEVIEDMFYIFMQFKIKKGELCCLLCKIVFNVFICCEFIVGECVVEYGLVVVCGVKVIKDVVNMLLNICNLVYLWQQV